MTNPRVRYVYTKIVDVELDPKNYPNFSLKEMIKFDLETFKKFPPEFLELEGTSHFSVSILDPGDY